MSKMDPSASKLCLETDVASVLARMIRQSKRTKDHEFLDSLESKKPPIGIEPVEEEEDDVIDI